MIRQSLLASLALLLAAAVPGCKPETKDRTRVRILATTDEHSHLLATGPERDEWPLPSATTVRDGALKGGMARRATVLEQQRADGVPTFVFSNGDFSQGTLTGAAFAAGNFDVLLMRQLGYDAIALANHEFDLGPTGLVLSIEAAQGMGGAPPFVLSNVEFSAASPDDDALAAMYGGIGSGKPIVSGVVIEKEGLKVGVVASLGPTAAYDAQYSAVPVSFLGKAPAGSAGLPAAADAIAAAIQTQVDALRDVQKVDVVVLLHHGGVNTVASPNGDADLIVARLSGVDAVVTGHTHEAVGATTLTDADSREVPVVQPAAYGNQVARVEFEVGGGRPSCVSARTAILDVDDTLPPTNDQEVRASLSTAISSMESALLPGTLTAVTGGAVVDNPVVVGDLYFYPLGNTTFDVLATGIPRENNALNLDTDAMLATARGLGYTTTAAIQNAGSMRGDLLAGDTGLLTFADVYRMVSLGVDPYAGTPGYPLVHVNLLAAELRAAFEGTLQLSFANNDYFLGVSGLTVEWNPARPLWDENPLNPGWITKLASVDAGGGETLLYDSTNGWYVNPGTTLIPLVTTYQVAAFAGILGLAPRDGTGTPYASLEDAIIDWPSTTISVKDHQALARYILGVCEANGGDLPAIYDAGTAEGQIPRRVCIGACPVPP